MNDNPKNSRRRAAVALLLLAAFSLLLTFAFLAPRPDAVAMQVGQTVRSTPSLTVIFPLQLPAPTRGPRPSPFVPPTIDDPAVVAALGVAWFVTWHSMSKSQTRLYGTNGSQSDQLHSTDLGKQWACP